MTRRTWTGRVAVIAVAGWLVACGGGGSDDADGTTPSDEPAASTGPVGPDGGEVTSDDGAAVLTVPAGALDEEVAIEIVATDGSAVEGADEPTAAYELRPDGLEFAEPAELTVMLPAPTIEAPAGPMVGLFSSEGGGRLEASAADVVSTPDSTTLTIPVGHFSEVAIQTVPLGTGETTAEAGSRGRALSNVLVPAQVELLVDMTFEARSVTCCSFNDDEAGALVGEMTLPVIFFIGASPVTDLVLTDFAPLPGTGVLVEEGDPRFSTAVHGAPTSRGFLASTYRCTETGSGTFGSVATYLFTYTSAYESVRDESTVRAEGRARCRSSQDAEFDAMVQARFDASAPRTTVETGGGETTTAPSTPDEVAAAVGLPTDALLVEAEGERYAVMAGPELIAPDGLPTCMRAVVGTGPDDNEATAVDVPPGSCPANASSADTAELIDPACATSGPEVGVVAFALPARTDGQLLYSAGVRIADDRIVAVGTNFGDVTTLEPVDLGVEPGGICAAVTEFVLANPAPAEEGAAGEIVNCVVARYDDAGRLPSFPASVLLFVRGPQPFSGATGIIEGAHNGEVINAYPDAGGWWIEGGVAGPGSYPISSVVVVTSAGEVDVTDEVIEVLGSDTIEATGARIVTEACD